MTGISAPLVVASLKTRLCCPGSSTVMVVVVVVVVTVVVDILISH